TCKTANTATSNEVTMTVNPNVTPSISIATPQTTICEGTNVTFTATQNGGTVQWRRNGSNVGTGGNTFSASNLTNNDKITAVLTSNATCKTANTATSNEVTMTVNPNVTPSISIATNQNSICEGDEYRMIANASEGVIQWFRNETNTGKVGNIYRENSLLNYDIIHAELTNTAICKNTDKAKSNVIIAKVEETKSVTITIESDKTEIQAGDFVNFSSLSNTNGEVKWFVNSEETHLGNAFTTDVLMPGDRIMAKFTPTLNSEDCFKNESVNSNEIIMRQKLVNSLTNSTISIRNGVIPNPNNGKFKIESNLKDFEIEIMNMLGENVMSTNSSQNNAEFDLSAFPSGVYMAVLKSDNKIEHYRIVMNR
ncbi:MAG: T9SS type A sorting domain-containing protein, partial [Cytophagales bacterium]